MSGSLFEVT